MKWHIQGCVSVIGSNTVHTRNELLQNLFESSRRPPVQGGPESNCWVCTKVWVQLSHQDGKRSRIRFSSTKQSWCKPVRGLHLFWTWSHDGSHYLHCVDLWRLAHCAHCASFVAINRHYALLQYRCRTLKFLLYYLGYLTINKLWPCCSFKGEQSVGCC